MQKSLDQKLAAIHADPQGCREFIIADAKDADMAFGIGAPGLSPERHDGELQFRTLAEFRQIIREIVEQGVVDIMLMSASTGEVLAIDERLFDGSHVTPAIRANDTTDIHVFRGSRVAQAASRPFRSATIDHVQCGHIDCDPDERERGINLGLYSITFNNDCELDLASLEAYAEFRAEAERKGFRHFLEIFNPNLPGAVPPELLPSFINDVIARTLAGVTSTARPLFLKIPYPGPKALAELVAYDPHLVVGILGGSSGTTRDAFQLIHDAQRHGARLALFGRKINNAENQLAFIQFLRHIVDGVIEPEEAVRAYHAVLERLGLRPHRALDDDLQLTGGSQSYSGRAPGKPARKPAAKMTSTEGAATGPAKNGEDRPNLAKMSSSERLAYHRSRINRLLGSADEPAS